jgi:hypothetical protein
MQREVAADNMRRAARKLALSLHLLMS